MKAFSPVRSVRKNSLSDHSLGISRSKTPVDDPMSLLYNMNDCYSKLKELVPSIPQNKKVTKMEILQHVIDYILDLQIALDSHPTIVSLHHQRPGQNQASRTPLTTLNTDISILSLQVRLAPSRAPRCRHAPVCPSCHSLKPVVETGSLTLFLRKLSVERPAESLLKFSCVGCVWVCIVAWTCFNGTCWHFRKRRRGAPSFKIV